MNSLDRKIDASRKRAEAERQQVRVIDRPPTEGLTSQQSTKDKDVPMPNQNPYKPGMP
jgi:hypothetical protein